MPGETVNEVCPVCGKRGLWDNRSTRRNPKAPDYKCKDKNCTGAIWLDAKPQHAPLGLTHNDDRADYRNPTNHADDQSAPAPKTELLDMGVEYTNLWLNMNQALTQGTERDGMTSPTSDAIQAAVATVYIQFCQQKRSGR